MKSDYYVLNHAGIKTPTLPPGYQLLQCGDATPREWLSDATGDNISEDNWYYCEMTGQYWAWKNTRGDNIGFCHYHRFLGDTNHIFSPEEIDELLKRYDIVLPYKWQCDSTAAEHFARWHSRHMLDVLHRSVTEIAPEYSEAMHAVFQSPAFHICNIYFMRREVFDRYCEFVFPVLRRMKECVVRNQADDQRYGGFAAERLLNIWLRHQSESVKIYETGMVIFDKSCYRHPHNP